jgi:hypothetical protein
MSDTTGQPKRLSDGEIIELIRALKDLLPDAGWLSTMGQRAVQNMVAAEIDLDNTRAELRRIEGGWERMRQLQQEWRTHATTLQQLRSAEELGTLLGVIDELHKAEATTEQEGT